MECRRRTTRYPGRKPVGDTKSWLDLTVRGDELAIDAGCGSGRLTGALMERLPARPTDRHRSFVEHAADGARQPAAGVRPARHVRAGLAARPAILERRRSRVQHRDVPLDQGSSGAVCRHLPRAAAGRTPARAVRRRAESCPRPPARRAGDARGAVRRIFHRLAGALGVRECGRHRRTVARGRLRRRRHQPRRGADHAGDRGRLSRVRDHRDLPSAPRTPAVVAIEAGVHRSRHRAVGGRRSAIHAGLLASQHGGAANHEHPSIIRPRRPAPCTRRRRWARPRSSNRRACWSASTRSNPARSTPCTRMPGRTRSISWWKGNGVFLLDGRELPMRPGDLLVAPEGVAHGVRNTGAGRLLVLAILAPAPHK